MLKRFYQSEEVAAQAKAKKILRDAEENAEILRKNKLLEAKDIVYNLEFNKETFKDDILKVYELKNNLN
jgi:ribonuclease Y